MVKEPTPTKTIVFRVRLFFITILVLLLVAASGSLYLGIKNRELEENIIKPFQQSAKTTGQQEEVSLQETITPSAIPTQIQPTIHQSGSSIDSELRIEINSKNGQQFPPTIYYRGPKEFYPTIKYNYNNNYDYNNLWQDRDEWWEKVKEQNQQMSDESRKRLEEFKRQSEEKLKQFELEGQQGFEDFQEQMEKEQEEFEENFFQE